MPRKAAARLAVVPPEPAAPPPQAERGQIQPMMQGAHFAVWSLVTDHPAAAVTAPGYFDPCANMLEPWDRLEVTAAARSGTPQHLLLAVQALVTAGGELVTTRTPARSRAQRTAVQTAVLRGPQA